MAPPENTRPGMRRKSSAQNLLSSFKTGPASSPVPPPLSMQGSVGSISSATGLSYVSAPTPTSTTPLGREWDSQSLQSDSTVPSTISSSATLVNGTPTIGQGTSVEYLRDLIQKRIITLTYIRNVHDGKSHWFHTIMMSRSELDRIFNNTAMKKRTPRFAILGMSLSNLFDIQQPQDLLRGLLNTMSEFEQTKEGDEKPKKSRLFKSKVNKRQTGGVNDYAISLTDASDTSYLLSPHIPFQLDYHQTLLSLLDVLSEVYNKISKILGPSPFPHSGQHMMGPLGLLAPHPGVSYLFTGNEAAPVTSDSDTSSLWGIANANVTAGPAAPFGGVGFHGSLGSPPGSWTPALGEMVLKVDGKMKKVISMLLKELDTFARNSIKDELASLDPLLRNVAVTEETREQYDFEGLE
ncbi:hypothetical protein JAAARDRAFT_56636 [Jaapia argillacea MUCL 33604]|uniref:Uncharacterized protein n=1 Tax=Jaapia argillacea MUCL 33604 TaxID=933084 RepID=A0A067PXT7_9AGAM|nr:hypothetical protein JAAARDRAFT_56636 [Jaapia argillacea MUCL 33604]